MSHQMADTYWREPGSGPDMVDILHGQKLLRRVTYRKDSTITLNGAGALIVEMLVDDSTGRVYPLGQTVRIAHCRPLPPWAWKDDDAFFEAVRRELHEVEKHESDEWFKVDGEARFFPHPR